jgi:HEPN domain-containing protein
MAEREITQEWLSKADEDFRFALMNFNEGKEFFAQICFHLHQAAEKFLKAYIVAFDLEF